MPGAVAVGGQVAPQRGRAEGGGDTLLENGLDELGGVGPGGARGIELGHDRGQAECGGEEREERQQRQVHLARLDAVGIADEVHLRVELAVGVAHALRRAGGAAGEEDGRRVAGVAGERAGVGGGPHGAGRGQARGGGAGNARANLHRTKRGAKHAGRDPRRRDADQRARAAVLDAAQKTFPAHAGVDDDGQRPELEKGEHHRDQRQALAHHHERAVAGTQPGGGETDAVGGDLGRQLGVTQLEIVDAAVAAAPRDF